MRHIAKGELEVGDPLPWDVFGESGGLLARKGYVIANEGQIENLVKRGKVVEDKPVKAPAAPPSVLRMLNAASRRLQSLLPEVANGMAPEVRPKLEEVARVIASAVDLNTEVALACILHNQQACPYPIRHSVDTAVVSLLVARAMKNNPLQAQTVVLAALTMNVGMLQHQERMQGTREALSANDVALIRSHPETGVAMLRRAGVVDETWLAAVLLHHENGNGGGYPYGYESDKIPEAAKIISMADRYCARVSARSYRKSMLPNAALRDILLEEKSPTDAQLAAVFIRELGIYPIGTFVRLLNGEIGVVTRKGLSSTTPIVDSLVGPRGAPLDVVIRRDTKNEMHAIREVLNEDQAAIGFNLDQLWGPVAAP